MNTYGFPILILLLVLLTGAAMVAAAQPVERLGTAVRGVELLNLAEVNQIEQRFVAEGEHLVGLRLGLKVDPALAELPLLVRVRAETGLPIDLLRLNVPLGQTEQGELEVRFPALATRTLPYVVSPTLRLIIEPPQLPEGTDLRILVSRQLEPHGAVMVNGEVDPAFSLAFTPSYEELQLDAYWPVAQMAARRAGVLGWPPFYPLLVGGFLIALAFAARNLYVVFQKKHLEGEGEALP